MGNTQGTQSEGARTGQPNEENPDDLESLPQLKRGFSLRRSKRLSKRFRSHKSEFGSVAIYRLLRLIPSGEGFPEHLRTSSMSTTA